MWRPRAVSWVWLRPCGPLDVAHCLTIDTRAFKVPHLASIPVKTEAEREPVGGETGGKWAGRGYQKGKKKNIACLDPAALSVNQRV